MVHISVALARAGLIAPTKDEGHPKAAPKDQNDCDCAASDAELQAVPVIDALRREGFSVTRVEANRLRVSKWGRVRDLAGVEAIQRFACLAGVLDSDRKAGRTR